MTDQTTGRPGEDDRSPEEAATPRQRVLNDRYELGDLIGRGGMADVWLARDLLLSRDVAVKILRSDLARDPVFQARFRREAKAVAGLNDHGIVAVYDTGDTDVELPGEQHPLKVPFIVMEYVKGHTLKSRLSGGPLPVRDAVNATLGVLAALNTSHAQGIVHRDIKPANVMITDAGVVKVMDFGIARALADSAATMTQTQAVVGTAQYLSPEQARGESVDERSDLYSTGCLLFELLTGRPPFVGDSPVSVAYQHVGEAPQLASSFNPAVTPALDAVISRSLVKDREDRFQSSEEFSSALRAAQRGEMPTQVQAGALDATRSSSALSAATPAAAYGGAAYSAAAGGAPEYVPGIDDTGTRPGILYQAEDDADDLKEHRNRKAIVWVVSIVLVLFIAAGGFALFKYLQAERIRNEPVKIPVLAGQTAQIGQQRLTELELQSTVTEQYSDTVDEGLVIDTDPAADQSVKKNSVVTLHVSKGPENVTIPDDLSGKSVDEARKALTTLHLEVAAEVREVEDATVAKGRVVGTDPKAGSSAKSGSTVTILVSKGQVSIPKDLEGKSQADVRKQLEALGLVVADTVTRVDNQDIDKDLVVGTDPAMGQKIKVGGTVKLQVSKGQVTIPDDLVGKLENDAREELKGLGLDVGTVNREDSTKPENEVLSVDPAAGETVAPGSTVDITVSKGQVTMPDVLSKTETEATNLLRDGSKYGLQVQVMTVNQAGATPGTVVSQSIQAGQPVKPGATVTLSVQQPAPPEQSGNQDGQDTQGN